HVRLRPGREGRQAAGLSWYRKGAEQGDKDSQYDLGMKLLKGDGVPRSLSEAAHWFGQSAAQGQMAAQFELAQLYAKGDGVKRDAVLAYAWYNVAIMSGHYPASKPRDALAKTMNADEIAEAEQLSAMWKFGQDIVRQ
ncbi:MAG: tetratricopeptide repeat protein, partial [Arenimonas sp.]